LLRYEDYPLGGNKMSIKIVTDSTAYLPNNLRQQYDINVVSLGVSFEMESFNEEDIANDTFYDKMAQSNGVPTSSQPAINDLYNAFEEPVRNGQAVVGVFLSSDMSGTYSTAVMAKNMVLEKHPQGVIELIDSRSNCMQSGFVSLAAAKAAKAGEAIEEVVRQARSIIERSRFLFVPEVLDYLKKGGRIGGASAVIGSILQIKPILTVVDGKTAVFNKVRTKKRAVQTIVDAFLEDIKDKGLGDVIVHHINNEMEGLDLAKTIQDTIGRAVEVYSIGPVIGLHVGPGTLGIAYYTER
jgi:DegV family protein with EDD domain